MEILVTGQHQGLSHHVFGQPEGPSAVGLPEPAPGVGLHVFLVQHKACWISHLGEEVGLGFVYRYLDGLFVNEPNARNRRGVSRQLFLYADNVAQVLVGHRRFGQRICNPLQRPLHVVSRHRRAIVEFGVGAQMEGVDPAVVADTPAFCQVRHYVEVRVDGYQAAEDLDDDASGRCIGREVRVQGWGINEEMYQPANITGRALPPIGVRCLLGGSLRWRLDSCGGRLLGSGRRFRVAAAGHQKQQRNGRKQNGGPFSGKNCVHQ